MLPIHHIFLEIPDLCPHCGEVCNAAIGVSPGGPPPEDGDLSVCTFCAGLRLREAGQWGS